MVSKAIVVPSLAAMVLLASFACGPKPRPIPDAGEPEPEDAGVDAGWPRGDEPPLQYSIVVEQPAAAAATNRTGLSPALALDQHDQPLVAFFHADPNGDAVTQDGKIEFTRWNGVEKKWQEPKTIEIVGELDLRPPRRQVAIARDATSGRLGIAYAHSNGQLKLALSEDEGANWTITTVATGGSNVAGRSDPALVLANREVHLAWFEACSAAACDAIKYQVGITVSTVPGTRGPSALSLAVDSAGKPGLAYFNVSAGGTGVDLMFLRPGTPAVSATKVVDSQGVASVNPAVALTFEGEKPRLAYHLNSADLRYSAASGAGGLSWAAAVPIPRNGSVGKEEGTRDYQAIAVDSVGKVSIAGNYAIATQPSQVCGGPKLARSSDGTSFTVCSPDGGKVLGFAGQWVNLAVSKSNKLTLVFLYDQASNPQIKPGVVLWREP